MGQILPFTQTNENCHSALFPGQRPGVDSIRVFAFLLPFPSGPIRPEWQYRNSTSRSAFSLLFRESEESPFSFFATCRNFIETGEDISLRHPPFFLLSTLFPACLIFPFQGMPSNGSSFQRSAFFRRREPSSYSLFSPFFEFDWPLSLLEPEIVQINTPIPLALKSTNNASFLGNFVGCRGDVRAFSLFFSSVQGVVFPLQRPPCDS